MAPRTDNFTERARRVLTFAQEEAQRLDYDSVGTEHLLLGLLRVTDGVGAAILATFGVDFDKCRDGVKYIMGHGRRPQRGEIGLTRGARKVIEFAQSEARRMKLDPGTEHLLLGIVAKRSIAAGVLDTYGCTLDAVREAATPEFSNWVHAQRGAHDPSKPESSGGPNRLRAAQAAIQAALDAVSAAPVSRFERDLVDSLLVPQLMQMSGELYSLAYTASAQALRQRLEDRLRLLAESTNVFRNHGMPGVADALDSAWVEVRRVVV